MYEQSKTLCIIMGFYHFSKLMMVAKLVLVSPMSNCITIRLHSYISKVLHVMIVNSNKIIMAHKNFVIHQIWLVVRFNTTSHQICNMNDYSNITISTLSYNLLLYSISVQLLTYPIIKQTTAPPNQLKTSVTPR